MAVRKQQTQSTVLPNGYPEVKCLPGVSCRCQAQEVKGPDYLSAMPENENLAC